MGCMQITDRTLASPIQYRVRTRGPDEVDLVVLHQTGTPEIDPSAPILDRVKAHILILQSGEVRLLHPLLARLRYGSSLWNRRGVTVECQGNYPTRYNPDGSPVWWSPETAGAQVLAEHPEQIQAVRDVLAWLRGELPSPRFIGGHRQIQKGKAGCPGPDLWRQCGEFALKELGYELVPTAPTGSDIPDSWRR